MLFDATTFIGIDVSGGRKPFTYAALDGDGKLIALAEGEIEEVLAFLGGQRSAYVAVNAPSHPNKGLMKQEEVRRTLVPLHQPGRGAEMRLVEYQLRGLGIAVAQTPARAELAPTWMQVGFALYQKLAGMGYKPYPADGEMHQWIETHPHAVFCVLLGQIPLQKHTLEGRLQRQLVLHDRGMGIRDPMDFFEEITRHRLFKGILPMEHVYAPAELDSLSAAYTAFLAGAHPSQVTVLGPPQEGVVVLPVLELKQKY